MLFQSLHIAINCLESNAGSIAFLENEQVCPQVSITLVEDDYRQFGAACHLLIFLNSKKYVKNYLLD